MANTLEGLSGISLVAAHNSTTDLTDKTPLQAYRGATVSQLATAARVAQKQEASIDTGQISAVNMLKRIIVTNPASSLSLTTQGAATIIETLSLAKQNDSFEFTIINIHGSNVATLDNGAAGVSIIGNAAVAAGTSAQFRIRSSVAANDEVIIYRVA